jgi:hypothetical protein
MSAVAGVMGTVRSMTQDGGSGAVRVEAHLQRRVCGYAMCNHVFMRIGCVSARRRDEVFKFSTLDNPGLIYECWERT